MPNRNNVWANIDWITVSIYLAMMFIGWINIYAAVYNEEHRSIFDFSQQYGKQLIWIGASIFIAVLMLNTDSKFFVAFSFPIYVLLILTLMLVLAIGTEINGAKAWIQIGSVSLQPSEFMKMATSLAIARYISSYNFKMHNFKSLVTLSAIILLPVGLIFLQNDTGSALVFGVFLLVLYREGLNGIVLFFTFLIAIVFILTMVVDAYITLWVLTVAAFVVYYQWRHKLKTTLIAAAVFVSIYLICWLISLAFQADIDHVYFILIAALLSAAFFAFYATMLRKTNLIILLAIYAGSVLFSVSVDYVFENIMEPHQRDRINELLGIKSDVHGAGYHVNQSKIAIGSGGFFGKGFLQGTQTKYDFVPEQSTDFIFCTVGEEWGFIGTTVVIGLFMGLLMRLIYLAERNRSKFSRVYGYCVATILFFHFAVNIGMTIGLAPVIGIPLPFFSYGGSSLWSFTLLLFVFVRLDASRFEQLSF
ncbi:MAG TPA: rod shape-determining protein RodA [Prolixibacteraceae bacterium]|nr:rod shape-determining protein RodA [Prolixibacteraceae bacterium]